MCLLSLEQAGTDLLQEHRWWLCCSCRSEKQGYPIWASSICSKKSTQMTYWSSKGHFYLKPWSPHSRNTGIAKRTSEKAEKFCVFLALNTALACTFLVFLSSSRDKLTVFIIWHTVTCIFPFPFCESAYRHAGGCLWVTQGKLCPFSQSCNQKDILPFNSFPRSFFYLGKSTLSFSHQISHCINTKTPTKMHIIRGLLWKLCLLFYNVSRWGQRMLVWQQGHILLHVIIAMQQLAPEGQTDRMISDVEVQMKHKCVTEFLHMKKTASVCIHRCLLNVYGDQTMGISIVRW